MKPKVTLPWSRDKLRQSGPQCGLLTSVTRMQAHVLHLGFPTGEITGSHGLGPGTEPCT